MLERKNHRLICIWPKTEKNRDRKAGVPQEPQVLRISRITRTDQALSSERVPLLSHYRLPMAVAHAETAKEREESARAREGVLPGRWRTVWISKAFGIHGPAIHHPTVSRPLSEAPGTFARLDLLPSALVMNHRRGGRGANWPCVAVARNLLRSVALTTHAVLSGEAHSFIARIVVVYIRRTGFARTIIPLAQVPSPRCPLVSSSKAIQHGRWSIHTAAILPAHPELPFPATRSNSLKQVLRQSKLMQAPGTLIPTCLTGRLLFLFFLIAI